MSGANLTQAQIDQRKLMKEELARAAQANKVNAVSGAGADKAMIAHKNAIKNALQMAIHEKMITKTRKMVGDNTLHKAIID